MLFLEKIVGEISKAFSMKLAMYSMKQFKQNLELSPYIISCIHQQVHVFQNHQEWVPCEQDLMFFNFFLGGGVTSRIKYTHLL